MCGSAGRSLLKLDDVLYGDWRAKLDMWRVRLCLERINKEYFYVGSAGTSFASAAAVTLTPWLT